MDTTQQATLSESSVPGYAEDARARAQAVVTWLLEDERLRAARAAVLFDRLARRLVDAGLPISRASLHIQQLHPLFAARSLVWDAGAGKATELGHNHGAQHEPSYLASPVRLIFEGGPALRRRLDCPECPLDFPILHDLKAEGLTDYTIVPLVASGGRTNALSIATHRPGGFTDLDLVVLDRVLPAFGAVLELQQLRRTARDLLSTYVGPSTGERIFSGTIQRGDGEIIHAVLWYCDLRGFTGLSEREPLDQVIGLLNDYFDRIVEPVVAQGGEILKFIGDAVLAIFPCKEAEAAQCGAADAALVAAEAAIAGVAELNESRSARGEPPLHSGIAVHVGKVMYGNVGAADRLDFTVIGPAVNLVSRLEPLCAELDQPIVVSADIARVSRRAFRSLGRHALKGIARETEVFAPLA